MEHQRIPKSKLKLLYIEVLKGYSVVSYRNDEIYIKHFTTFDVGDAELKYESFINKAREEGLPTQEEKENYLIREGFWTEQKNSLILEYKDFVKNLKITKSKLFREAEINGVQKQINEFETKISDLEKEKLELIQFTAEHFAAKKLHEYYIFNSFFRNSDLDDLFFKKEDFDELDEGELNTLTKLYNDTVEKFQEVNLKRLALSPQFFNYYCLTESAYEFYGKPIISLTVYQAELLNHAKYFKSILQNAKGKPPEGIMDDPEKLVSWYEGQQNVQEQLSKSGAKDASSLVGLSAKDRERLGLEDSGESINNKLVEMAKKKGGALGASEIMGLFGNK